MNPLNPLADREKALEDQYIKEKECVCCSFIPQDECILMVISRKQMAKDRATKAQAAKNDQVQGQQSADKK